jgi:GT2 family glycosyltransferase
MTVELSYCVVNTARRQLLNYCLDAIAREGATLTFETETLVLDNASHDGSAEAARSHPATTKVIALARHRAVSANATELLQLARGRFCLLLTEASELEPGATAQLHTALAADDGAAAATATLVNPDGRQQPSAWAFPRPWTRRPAVQSRGSRVRDVDWARTAALLVRREAAAGVGWFESSDVEFCRRLHDAGWRVLYVPEARAVADEGGLPQAGREPRWLTRIRRLVESLG